jgi:CYTH domain-containing protein
MAVEREIRFRVTDGEPPPGGAIMTQVYLLRGRATARVRVTDGRGARLTVKLPRAEGRHEWEWRLPAALGRALLRLPLPRVEKTRLREGRLEVDRLAWPPGGIVLVELELAPGEGPDLRDAGARARFMAAHRPDWVRAWHDVTEDPDFTNARLARRPPRAGRGPSRAVAGREREP